MTCRHDPTARAAHRAETGLDTENEPIVEDPNLLIGEPAAVGDVDAKQVNRASTRAVATMHSAGGRRLGHRRGPSVGLMVTPDPEGPPRV